MRGLLLCNGSAAPRDCTTAISLQMMHHSFPMCCASQHRGMKSNAATPKRFLPFKQWKLNVEATAANAAARNVNVDVAKTVGSSTPT